MHLFLLLLALTSPVAMAQDDPDTQTTEADGDRSVRNTVRVYTNDIVICYGRAARRQSLSGVLEVAGTVDHSSVVELRIVGDAVGSKKLTKCVQRKIKRWIFQDDYTGDFSWPFDFHTS